MKKYGIYLAYQPMVNLFAEGLGRHLIEFLKGAQHRGDVYFVIACPSWMRANLTKLFENSAIQPTCYELIGPQRIPFLLNCYEKYIALKQRQPRKKLKRCLSAGNYYLLKKTKLVVERKIVTMRSSPLPFLLAMLALCPLFIAALLLKLVTLLWQFAGYAANRILVHAKKYLTVNFNAKRTLITNLRLRPNILNLYQLMLEAETTLMLGMIKQRNDVKAWYSPTAFWPSFNRIEAPRLLCVPDVVMTDFPIGFSTIERQRFLTNFQQVEQTIRECDYLVTYSDEVKWKTLVHRYHKNPAMISVVQHGANRLDDLIMVSDVAGNRLSTTHVCCILFKDALAKQVNGEDILPSNTYFTSPNKPRFLFYASQFRPNKNILSLLRAYNYLLKQRFLGIKLVLTGHPDKIPDISHFIAKHHLENDIVCLHGLSAQELAACYHLADVAVNPSLSEGGCPFTFTEALSVGTPVVMARIPVTEEVITCPEVTAVTLFDPYDWKDMADKIEWAVYNREQLLAKQIPFYKKLAERTWENVVKEYMHILEKISQQPNDSLRTI